MDTNRLAVPEQAGTVKPEEWLPRSKRELFTAPRQSGLARGPTPRGCYMVSRAEEDRLRKRLLDSKMAALIPESEVPLTPEGNPLLAGLFCVGHKPTTDRMIFDRRPGNHLDLRFGWCRLPLGSQLTQMVVEPHESVRGSGDDLRAFFYCLRNWPAHVRYNAFGRSFLGDDWVSYGARCGQRYRLALLVVPMGDCNAVDVAQESHRAVLHQFSCLDRRHEIV